MPYRYFLRHRATLFHIPSLRFSVPSLYLTDRTVSALPLPATGQVLYFDTNLTGFAVRCSQGGAKTYLVVIGTQRRKVTIGRVGIVTLAQARNKARELLAHHTLNPSLPASLHALDALTRYLAVREQELKASTYAEHTRLLRRHFPTHSHLPDLSTDDIALTLESIQSISERAHAYTAFKTFLNWCMDRRYIRTNPISPLKKPKTAPSRERVLNDHEIKLLWYATQRNDLPFYLRNTEPYHQIIRVLLLTGQRAAQIGHLQEKWVDLNKDIIVFPREIMKSNKEHVLPIPRTVRGILTSIRPKNGYYFANPAMGKPFTNWSTSQEQLRHQMQIPHWTPHDLRRTWATLAAQCDIEPYLISRVLSHSQPEGVIAAIYNRHRYTEKMRDALARVEDHILTLLAP